MSVSLFTRFLRTPMSAVATSATPAFTVSSQQLFRRAFSTAPDMHIKFVTHDGSKSWTCGFKPGQTVLQVAHDNNIDIEGACGGECACSTCHVILKDADFDRLPEPTDEEFDMLDLALDVTDTSRLGCQIKLKESDKGLELKLPKNTVNQMVQ
eukprot:GDKI01033215.1.p1 GENE.GDKI01033215.1~~GDKI01033215.1.p1  ORF type:complete len:153 (+),score=30.77 GDKI01033215.1:81-539(+)